MRHDQNMSMQQHICQLNLSNGVLILADMWWKYNEMCDSIDMKKEPKSDLIH